MPILPLRSFLVLVLWWFGDLLLGVGLLGCIAFTDNFIVLVDRLHHLGLPGSSLLLGGLSASFLIFLSNDLLRSLGPLRLGLVLLSLIASIIFVVANAACGLALLRGNRLAASTLSTLEDHGQVWQFATIINPNVSSSQAAIAFGQRTSIDSVSSSITDQVPINL